MSELINAFTKLSEFYHPNLCWEQVEAIYEKAESDKASDAKESRMQPSTSRGIRAIGNRSSESEDEGIDLVERSVLNCIPLVRIALKNSNVLSALLDLTTTIRAIRESSTSYDNTFDSWDQVIKVSPRNGYLAFIYTLVGLGTFDPKCRRYRQLSLAAASAYFLSLTIPGAKGFHVFEEEIISVALQVFTLVEKIQHPDVAKYLPSQQTIETWVNFTAFCDDLKLMFRYVHFEEYKSARNAIIKKLIDMQYMNYERGFVNVYAANLHGKYFEILDEIVSAHNGDPEETLLKIMNMTLFLHTYTPKPRGFAAPANSRTNACEHISDWFIKIIGKFPRIVSEVLDFYIKCVVTNPEKGWRTEQTQRALDYAAKYDAALFTRCNASIVEFLCEAVYADEASIRSRAVDLLSKMVMLESNVDWQMFRHEVSETPREVYILKELIDSIRDSNNNIKIKAIQAIHQALVKGSPNARKVLMEGLTYAQYNDCGVELPEEPRVLKNEIRFEKPIPPEPGYTFAGVEIITLSFLHLPEHVYTLFSNSTSHVRRAAIMMVETIAKINPLVIFNTNFVKETCVLVGDPVSFVRKQSMIMCDSILTSYPNCYPVIYAWCRILAPMLQDADPKNIELAMECFRARVLLNIRSIDQTNQAEHFMPWVIIRTLLMTHSRLYLQSGFHMALKTHMINQPIISTVESHILASNSTEAWILLNFICGKIKSKEPDSLIHSFVSYHSSLEWNNEQNLLIALEVLITCAKDFSYPALNYAFKHLLQSIKSGMIIPQVIGKAFDFLTTISHLSKENHQRSTASLLVDVPSQDWIIDLHIYLEDKLLEEMQHFPENRSVYMSHLFSYSEANLQIKIRPHRTIVTFLHKYILACVRLPESELELDNDRIFNLMILIAGRFSIREHTIASTTCKLYGRILKAIDRPPIVNTILVAIADLCKKHTQIVETIMDAILKKLSSPYLMNRMETFRGFASLVLQDQLKLRGSLLLGLLAVILDDCDELSEKAIAFFAEFVSKKNPALFHKCLNECPFVLNEYPNFEGLDSFTENMIRSPLKGDGKRKARYKLYNHLMDSIDDIQLIMYFGNLKILAEKTQNDPHITTPEGTALLKDILFILKRVCQRERKDPENQQQSENSTDDPSNPTSAQNEPDPGPSTSAVALAQGRRGRRRDIPTIGGAMSILEKSIAFIVTIAENTAERDASIQKAIDELAKALLLRFPQIIEYAQPAEFWTKYRQGRVTSTPNRRRRGGEENTTDDQEPEEEISDVEDDDDDENDATPTPAKRQRSTADVLEYMLLP